MPANLCLQQRCNDLERAISRLELITSHDALVLLRASFSAPIMQHTLRSSPCAGRVELTQFDALLRSALSKICNISLTIGGCRQAYPCELAVWELDVFRHW